MGEPLGEGLTCRPVVVVVDDDDPVKILRQCLTGEEDLEKPRYVLVTIVRGHCNRNKRFVSVHALPPRMDVPRACHNAPLVDRIGPDGVNVETS